MMMCVANRLCRAPARGHTRAPTTCQRQAWPPACGCGAPDKVECGHHDGDGQHARERAQQHRHPHRISDLRGVACLSCRRTAQVGCELSCFRHARHSVTPRQATCLSPPVLEGAHGRQVACSDSTPSTRATSHVWTLAHRRDAHEGEPGRHQLAHDNACLLRDEHRGDARLRVVARPRHDDERLVYVIVHNRRDRARLLRMPHLPRRAAPLITRRGASARPLRARPCARARRRRRAARDPAVPARSSPTAPHAPPRRTCTTRRRRRQPLLWRARQFTPSALLPLWLPGCDSQARRAARGPGEHVWHGHSAQTHEGRGHLDIKAAVCPEPLRAHYQAYPGPAVVVRPFHGLAGVIGVSHLRKHVRSAGCACATWKRARHAPTTGAAESAHGPVRACMLRPGMPLRVATHHQQGLNALGRHARSKVGRHVRQRVKAVVAGLRSTDVWRSAHCDALSTSAGAPSEAGAPSAQLRPSRAKPAA
jgi:hypothetical protein